MISFDPFRMIPKPLLWICAVPCMVLLLPIGLVYCSICFINAVRAKETFNNYRHDILYAVVRPGFYLGQFVALLVHVVLRFPIIIKDRNRDKANAIKLNNKRKECDDWSSQFNFIGDVKVDTRLYISKQKAVGRLIISKVNDEQAAIIEKQRGTVPKDVYLDVLSIKC